MAKAKRKVPDEFTRPHLEDACDRMDAEVFTGDAFHNKHNRTRLRWYMKRWERELKVIDQSEDEYESI